MATPPHTLGLLVKQTIDTWCLITYYIGYIHTLMRKVIDTMYILLHTTKGPKICQFKINSRSVAGPMGQMNRRPSL